MNGKDLDLMDPTKLRRLPQVGRLVEREDARSLVASYSHSRVIEALRAVLNEIRLERAVEKDGSTPLPTDGEIVARAERILRRSAGPGVRKAINATGVILHTGLGRAILPAAARRALYEMDGYCLVQMDPVTGERCLREAHIQKILTRLTGAEASTVVNNNAGATLLVLNTIAKNREVIVSRGQLVEIGGSFRIPDVMKQSGARLVEVGTTNRTHLRDYERAITEETAALLHVHTSNYRIKGFTKTVPVADLAALGRERGLPVVDDLGSGALVDLARFGFGTEPLARDSIRDGADLVTFSADKLVGGPQGGIILGRKKYVEMIRKNSLARALRVGKLTLTALEMTLKEFLDEETLVKNHPIMRLFSIPAATLKRRARRLADRLAAALPEWEIAVERGAGRIGSGSLPLEDVPTWTVAVRPAGVEAGKVAEKLRLEDPPVIARLHDDRIVLDLRTILDFGEEKAIVRSLEGISKKGER